VNLRSNTSVAFEDVYGCSIPPRRSVTRECLIENQTRTSGNQETWKEGGQVRKSEPASGLWSFGANELPGMPVPCKRTSSSDGSQAGTSARSLARATANPLARSPSREHRNAGRIALSPADRRSISYEYRCPWRYTTSDRVVFSQKYVPDTRKRRLASSSHGRLLPKCRATRVGFEISDVSR